MARSRCARRAVMAAALVACGWAHHADGVTRSWTFNGNGSWSVAANWSGAVLPAAADIVALSQGAFTVTYDSTVTPLAYGTATLSTGMTLALTSGTFSDI